MKKQQKITLESIKIHHAKSVVLCVVILFAAIPVGVSGLRVFDFNLGMLLTITAIVGWIWSSIESTWRCKSWLSGYYDDDK